MATAEGPVAAPLAPRPSAGPEPMVAILVIDLKAPLGLSEEIRDVLLRVAQLTRHSTQGNVEVGGVDYLLIPGLTAGGFIQAMRSLSEG